MKSQWTIFIIFTMCCLPISEALGANELDPDFKNYIQATAYRKGMAMCYAFLYHGKAPSIKDWSNSLLSNNIELREGAREWLFLLSRAFLNRGYSLTLIELLPLGLRDHYRDIISLTSLYAQHFVNTENFEHGVMDCARGHNSNDPEGFLNFMRQAILRTDQAGGVLGAMAGLTSDIYLGTYLFKYIAAGWSVFSQTGFTSWISNTRVASILATQMTFIARHKWKFAGGAVASVISGFSGYYYKIYRDNKARRQASRSGFLNSTSNMRQHVLDNRWNIRRAVYQSRIFDKIEDLEQTPEQTLEHIRLAADISIHLDHHTAENYREVKSFVEEQRELATQVKLQGPLQDQYLFFSGVLEMFELRKRDLEDELLALENGEAVVNGIEGYDRHTHLKVLVDLMELEFDLTEIERGNHRVGRRTGLSRSKLLDRNEEYKDLRLEHISL